MEKQLLCLFIATSLTSISAYAGKNNPGVKSVSIFNGAEQGIDVTALSAENDELECAYLLPYHENTIRIKEGLFKKQKLIVGLKIKERDNKIKKDGNKVVREITFKPELLGNNTHKITVNYNDHHKDIEVTYPNGDKKLIRFDRKK